MIVNQLSFLLRQFVVKVKQQLLLNFLVYTVFFHLYSVRHGEAEKVAVRLAWIIDERIHGSKVSAIFMNNSGYILLREEDNIF